MERYARLCIGMDGLEEWRLVKLNTCECICVGSGSSCSHLLYSVRLWLIGFVEVKTASTNFIQKVRSRLKNQGRNHFRNLLFSDGANNKMIATWRTLALRSTNLLNINNDESTQTITNDVELGLMKKSSENFSYSCSRRVHNSGRNAQHPP